MSVDELPIWLAVLVGVFALIGAMLTLIGTIGLARFQTFYQRVHAPTLGTSLGAGFILLGSIVYFTATRQRLSVHEILIFIFVSVTTPVTLMLLARAALYRDRTERNGVVPTSDHDVIE